ncbi:DUF4132 domain-containing protein [Verrucomicrobium sp. BvORR034]|uniref:DUF4132 domain-containing protein n=1 Tax=Verrucomicrobium sp. BvORR034 TaxID=1396418 RepID=UPI000678CD5E|nr:DUF4132 domain-containing protein [Verrucomicrobium sp. BvORR034]
MSDILKALDDTAKHWLLWKNPAITRFIETGDESLLNGLKLNDGWLHTLYAAVPAPGDLDVHGVRLLRMAVIMGLKSLLKDWLHRYDRSSNGLMYLHPAAVQRLRDAGMTDAEIRLVSEHAEAWDHVADVPTLVGEFYLQMDESEIPTLITQYSYGTIAFLISRRFPDILLKLLHQGVQLKYRSSSLATYMRANPEVFHESTYAELLKTSSDEEKVFLAGLLFDVKPELYRKTGWEAARRSLSGSGNAYSERQAGELLIKTEEPAAFDLVRKWLASPCKGYGVDIQRGLLLDELAKAHPAELWAACIACTQSPNGSVALLGLKRLRTLPGAAESTAVVTAIRALLGNSEPSSVVAALSEAISWGGAQLTEEIWALLQHKSRPVRMAAARALAALAQADTQPRAVKLLAHKKTDVRLAAVAVLEQLGTQDSLAALKGHLEVEEGDDVRDAILLALERVGGGATLTKEEIEARIQKTLAKMKEPPVPWLKPADLPLAKQDGTNLSDDKVLYLLYRQSRCKEMRADLEAKPLYAELDRGRNGGSAANALAAYLASDQNADHRWVLTWAALVGDDRVVTPLFKAVLEWAENSRGKLAEYGAQALALLGTDQALMMVESLSVRFRVKNKNIGKAAGDAFAEAAEARGVSVEELGDLVVPWLGFEAGKPRLVETGKTTVEVSIDQDFKLSFRDTKTGKRSGKLPTGASAGIQAEFKEMANTLKEAAKAQVLRIETLLVRQFRWPVSRWQELYLRNPLLRPFTQRLVWSWQGEAGEPTLVFRALEDGTLTDVNEDSVTLPMAGSVTIVHPLDLEETTRTAWLQHLADYDIAPPFPQLDRPVIRAKDEEREMRFGKHVRGTELNAMTFRGRAEKIGWVRGSVVDGGGVTSYRKTFTAAGVEAFLNVDGMYIGIGMDDTITLGNVYFVRTGTVKTGSYTYDEPSKEDDPRLVPFGEVPPVPFSEVMGDLRKISGKTGEEIDNEQPPA